MVHLIPRECGIGWDIFNAPYFWPFQIGTHPDFVTNCFWESVFQMVSVIHFRFTIARQVNNSGQEEHYVCLAVSLSARDKALMVSTQESKNPSMNLFFLFQPFPGALFTKFLKHWSSGRFLGFHWSKVKPRLWAFGMPLKKLMRPLRESVFPGYMRGSWWREKDDLMLIFHLVSMFLLWACVWDQYSLLLQYEILEKLLTSKC